ncbi:MAG: glycoside hydrolase family 31 protein [Candidatus Krumholzibacteria bacterium]|nr:glycoside hydrolase family 31 protein [Candidatus Krumholzibacteria bacterium]
MWHQNRAGLILLTFLFVALGGGLPTVSQALVTESLGPDLARFYASEAARAGALPSLSVTGELPSGGPLSADWSLRPVFSQVQGRAAVSVAITAGTSLYGTGEVAGSLLRNETRAVAWNHDAYGWGGNDMSLYQSHPWVLAVRPDGTSFGVLADTPNRCLIDLRGGIRFESAGPEFPVYIITGETPAAVLKGLAQLIGTMPLPPLWSLGYHQCRYSYTPDDRVREVAGTFRDKKIPCDVIWLDIDYMNANRSFTFHPTDFPEPRRLMQELHADGFHTVAIIDPGIKEEVGYHVYDSGEAINAWVQTASGAPYRGNVWPGRCVFPDFTNAAVRQWWGGLYGQFLTLGVDGIWNDMNEPAIFNTPTKTMPLSNLHRADEELGGLGTHARYHNVYGMLMARATWEGVRAARPNQRPFVLSRANHLGGQQWAACWTGDNTANWKHVDWSISMTLNLGLSGQPMVGPDIGGFIGAGSDEMFARWMGIGALLPFARGHTGKGNIDKEPWSFGGRVEDTCRRALERRYRLLPYFYTLMREAAETGLPPARPTFFAEPSNPDLRAVEHQFLLGNDLMVVANVHETGAGDPAVLPVGTWSEFQVLAAEEKDPDLPRLYLRGGAILVLGPIVQHTGELTLDELELVVSLDAEGRAEGLLYEDDGDGYGYEKGEYRLTRFVARQNRDTVQVRSEIVGGNWPERERRLTIRVLKAGASR